VVESLMLAQPLAPTLSSTCSTLDVQFASFAANTGSNVKPQFRVSTCHMYSTSPLGPKS